MATFDEKQAWLATQGPAAAAFATEKAVDPRGPGGEQLRKIAGLRAGKHATAAGALGVDPTTITFDNVLAALGKTPVTDPATGAITKPTPFADPTTGAFGGFLPTPEVPFTDPSTGETNLIPFGTDPQTGEPYPGVPDVPAGKEEWEAMVRRRGGERADPLLAAIQGRLGAERPGVQRRAFSPFAERGFGVSGIAERGVGEALGIHTARGEQEQANVRNQALAQVMEEELRKLGMGTERYEARRG